jgi:voltage-gated potassium channel
VVLGAGRVHPTPVLHLWGSALVIVTLLLYVRIVLIVMFRKGPVTWGRIQGGFCVYLLIGMVWASAFQFLEQLHPGSFYFTSAPTDIDQLTSKLTYFSFATLTTVGSFFRQRSSERSWRWRCGRGRSPDELLCHGFARISTD